ncbi:MAG: heparan-alpha-glucosaminide N-acetyltransferase [Phascolarctobacterium sp.]
METKPRQQATTTERYHFVDALRGLAISGVVLYHLLYDIYHVYGYDPHWAQQLYCRIWQEGTCFLFIAMAGFVWRLGSKSSLRRGLELNLLGLVITLVTFLVIPSETIWFGILNFMGCATWLAGLCHPVTKKLSPSWGMLLGLMVFLTCRQLSSGLWGIAGLFAVTVPEAWYSTNWLTPLGLPPADFRSSDYFPLLPWLGAYFFGYYLYAFLQAKEALGGILHWRVPVFSPLGLRSLEIYLLHQPLCFGLVTLFLN